MEMTLDNILMIAGGIIIALSITCAFLLKSVHELKQVLQRQERRAAFQQNEFMRLRLKVDCIVGRLQYIETKYYSNMAVRNKELSSIFPLSARSYEVEGGCNA